MGVSNMKGTPWHLERVQRKDDDERRYKGRCKYYNYDGDKCTYKVLKCTGSAHCNKYVAISEAAFKEKRKVKHSKSKSQETSKGNADTKTKQKNRQVKRQIPQKEEDIYWY